MKHFKIVGPLTTSDFEFSNVVAMTNYFVEQNKIMETGITAFLKKEFKTIFTKEDDEE